MRWNKKKTENLVLYCMVLVLSAAFLWLGGRLASGRLPELDGDTSVPVAADVIEILERTVETYDLGSSGVGESVYITFSAKVCWGPQKGQLVTALQMNDLLMAGAMEEVEAGDAVLLYYEEQAFQGLNWMMGEYRRTDMMFWVLLLFVALLLILGRFQGLHTLVSLTLTVICLWQVFLPSVLSGYNIYFWVTICCLFVIVVTLLLVSGFSAKTACAAAGCMGGLAASGGLALVMEKAMKLTGVLNQETAYLSQANPQHPINMQGVIFAAIMIGALGAVMDVGLSLASALWELRLKGKDPTGKSLWSSGLAIGRDMLGTMSNTLILAYFGSSLATILMLAAYRSSPLGLLNRELVAVELLQMLVGSLGILLTVPATAAACVLLYPKAKTADE